MKKKKKRLQSLTRVVSAEEETSEQLATVCVKAVLVWISVAAGGLAGRGDTPDLDLNQVRVLQQTSA
ncbi:hypothetical protein E3U43_021878 [Larimichthys crocea]|uniref:Uncharacterized protein n=1 Tax=Larimichthys crocea TaxID=215358 RepID=A0ACD3R7G5_LARCR|nr:hypothetical protein E3U43_021878 [Larimichthys crocea]